MRVFSLAKHCSPNASPNGPFIQGVSKGCLRLCVCWKKQWEKTPGSRTRPAHWITSHTTMRTRCQSDKLFGNSESLKVRQNQGQRTQILDLSGPFRTPAEPRVRNHINIMGSSSSSFHTLMSTNSTVKCKYML
ncbi:hypothetical protein CEXT_642181 [Caerostris extrusa]|uniref:Uncharacterized protein n=1 Tax=Caerostris extrusa TaxID=172846 RepID=A0AAV4WCX3_CAEEX|nr:hypothetical protein CEXT_642181 [Caerostris extrusa]